MARKKTPMSWQFRLFTVVLLAASVVFQASTLILLIGMMPTIVAFLIDKSKSKNFTLTVGAMNISGVIPFLITLWTGPEGNTLATSLDIIGNPVTIIVIYSLAGTGWMINWAMSSIVSAMVVKRAQSRLEEIKKRKARLIERWGEEVSGDIPLDAYGFPILGDE